jgi:carbon monoxide dehydrogenase subunit G
MDLSVFVEIEKPIEDVWEAIIDFKNCTNYIEMIL